MKKYIFTALILLSLSSCSIPEYPDSEQNPSSKAFISESQPPPSEKASYPINYREQAGIWLPYMQFEDYMYGKSEEEYRSAVRNILDDAENRGLNTVYFHVHPNGDAYYKSDIFPKGIFLDGDYDPLEIMIEEAHSKGISVQAWINPLRLQTTEQAENIPDSFITKQWISDPENRIAKAVNGRYYLDPSYPETAEIIGRCADEILDRYEVDGIHIDDYFYPTSDPEFDSLEFEKSGQPNLAEWRRENCTRFVKMLYDTVKKHGENLIFSISPQGNIDSNYNSQFADVRLWGGTEGYCDVIIPQIYFGFKNECCPFEPTLRKWEEITADSNVSLVVGLGAYKVGKADKWAGAAGEEEWILDTDIIGRQKELVKNSSADGYVLYE